MGFIVLLLQLDSSRISFVSGVDEVVGGTRMVLLASVELLDFGLQHLLILSFLFLSHIVSLRFPQIPLLPQICVLVLSLLKSLLSDFSVCNSKVLVKAVSVCWD